MRLEDKTNRNFLETTKLLQELFHSLRTSLGVALTISKDAQKELPLTADDFSDAVSALEQIKATLNEFKPLLSFELTKCAELTIEELSSICKLEGYSLKSQQSKNFQIKMELNLFKIWIQSFKVATTNDRTLNVFEEEKGIRIELLYDKESKNRPTSAFLMLLDIALVEAGMKIHYLDGICNITTTAVG